MSDMFQSYNDYVQTSPVEYRISNVEY